VSEPEEVSVVPCRCEVLNVMSGDVARDYIRTHLQRERVDGMERAVHRCAESGVEWVEEHSGTGYRDDVTVLRRLSH
jgi:predicted amidohydrolase YtcJ